MERHGERRARHPQVSLQAENSSTGRELMDSLPELAPTPSERLESEEQAEIVRQAIGELPEELRAPLLLAEYEDRSHAEIWAILRCSANAVEMRLYRARKQLHARLEYLLQQA